MYHTAIVDLFILLFWHPARDAKLFPCDNNSDILMNSRFLETIQKTYKDLVSRLVDPTNLEKWVYSLEGADLWVDGTDALLSLQEDTLYSIIFEFSELCETHALNLEFNQQNLYKILEIFDLVSTKVHLEDKNIYFWEVLGFGILLVYSCGGIPRITAEELCIVNDTVVCLLSNSYRKLRFNAYNSGVLFIGLEAHKSTYFRPEFGVFLLAPPVLINDIKPPRVQFYSVIAIANHS
jgi:hypothetical protein